jgi:mRNA interferase RelE/StbE
MPWYRLAFKPQALADLVTLEKVMAQRLFDKTKWLASNVANLRHEPIAPDLPGLAKYAVGDWRIFIQLVALISYSPCMASSIGKTSPDGTGGSD